MRKIEIDCTWPPYRPKVVRLVDQEREPIARVARRLMQSGGLDQQLLPDLFIGPPPVVGSP